MTRANINKWIPGVEQYGARPEQVLLGGKAMIPVEARDEPE
jgi:hypothetical protein